MVPLKNTANQAEYGKDMVYSRYIYYTLPSPLGAIRTNGDDDDSDCVLRVSLIDFVGCCIFYDMVHKTVLQHSLVIYHRISHLSHLVYTLA